MIALAAALALAAAAPKVVDMHPGKAHDQKAAGWFLEDPRTGMWCGFTSRKALFAKGKEIDKAKLEEIPTYAWVMVVHGAIDSITVETESQDAFTDDKYRFDENGRVTELARTGHYIDDPWTTFYYRPDARGHVALPPAGRQAAANLSRTRKFTTYWLDWSYYDQLSDMPFASLIETVGGKTIVKPGCVAPARLQKKRR